LTARKRKGLQSVSTVSEAKRLAESVVEEEQQPKKSPRTKITAQVATDVVRELRWSALMLAPDQMGGSMSAVVERALRSELERLRGEYNEGKPFERAGTPYPRRGRLPGS
jgi:hypothetical protein